MELTWQAGRTVPIWHGVNVVLKNALEDSSILLPGRRSRMVGLRTHNSPTKRCDETRSRC